jgi:hypothetical protein
MIHKDKDELRYQANLAEASIKARDVDEMIDVWRSSVDKHPEEWKSQRQLENAFLSKLKRMSGWRTPKPNGVRTDFNGEIKMHGAYKLL